MAGGVDVVFQGTFFDGEFLGYADFLVRQEDGRYAVWDSKLARHAKVGALIQLAALTWSPGDGRLAHPLRPEDILVVAAYNAQVNVIRHHLAQAGLPGVRVGTVDRFQGQQAPVVLVSMACSAASEAPRGIAFLLNRNRVNVAVSRGQWRAVVIRSPELTHFLPGKPGELEELGAFIGLCNPEFAWDG